MESTSLAFVKYSLNKEIEGFDIEIRFECSIFGELLHVSSSFWLLPKLARKLTYGKSSELIDRQLKNIFANFRFLLPLLAVPEHLLPGNLQHGEKLIAQKFQNHQAKYEYAFLKKTRKSIQDEWVHLLINTSHQGADINFKRRLEIIYDLVYLKQMSIPLLINELRSYNDQLFVLPLIQGLNRKHTRFRSFAARWLDERLHENMKSGLEIALVQEDEWVRTTAINLLSKLAAQDMIALIGDMLVKDVSVKVRQKAAWFLGEQGVEQALPFLFKGAADENWLVRQNVMEAIGKIGHESAIKPLSDLLKNKSSDRTSIVLALSNLQYESVADLLIPYLEVEELKFTVIYALGKLKNPKAIIPIKKSLETIKKASKREKIEKILEELESL